MESDGKNPGNPGIQPGQGRVQISIFFGRVSVALLLLFGKIYLIMD
jgi:hypothetical protein